MNHRLVRLIFAIVAALFGAPAAHAAPPAEVPAGLVYTYNSIHTAAQSTRGPDERGPPAGAVDRLDDTAADRGVHGASARPNTGGGSGSNEYDATQALVHTARDAAAQRVSARAATRKQVRLTDGGLASFALVRVAAKGVTGAYDEALAGGRHAGFLRNYADKPTA